MIRMHPMSRKVGYLALRAHLRRAFGPVAQQVASMIEAYPRWISRALAALPAGTAERAKQLPLLQADVVTAPVKLQESLLLTLMNPNICVLLLTLGMLLISILAKGTYLGSLNSREY